MYPWDGVVGTDRVGYMDRQMDSRPVMYDNGSSSQLELCLLQYSDEINDGSCVDRAVVILHVKVLILTHHTTSIDLARA